MIRWSIWPLALGLVLAMGVCGCQSVAPPVTYYILTPIAEPVAETAATRTRGAIIGVRPVTLPGTIDRTQMVTRSGPHQMAVSSLHRWADYPGQLVQQTIGENLQALMPDARVVSAPWPMGLKPDVTVTVTFNELIGTADRQVLLSAIWTVADQEPASTDSYRLSLKEPITDKGYDGLVSAHSRALAALCREIADSLNTQDKYLN